VAAKILIVDDEPDTTFVMKLSLELEGFNVEAFNDPMLALNKFKPGMYDLLILDINMPNLDGLTLWYKLKDMDKKVKGIFLTAIDYVDDKRSRENLLSLNRKIFVKKPIEPRTFVRIVKAELGI
jgi:two-component system CheB/CheR fusion protein